ncbi:MAG: hypothetical protein KDK70_39000, partial [Myxococcales bacterium]|nr:hypothetical protein [Myxococcales bacterium]
MVLIFDLLRQGGWFLVPILGASLVGVALLIERLLYLRRDNILAPELDRGMTARLEAGDREGLRALCERVGSPLGRVIARGLERPRATAVE